MACPCCGNTWLCADCCCPDGSKPPASVNITLSNYRFCDQDDVGGENSGGRIYAPFDAIYFSDLSVEGSYTLKQDIFGPYKKIDSRSNREIYGASANNCVNYTYFQGGKITMSAGRWPPDAGTQYWLSFSGTAMNGTPMSLESVFGGGRLFDICVGGGTQPDARASFVVRRNGAPLQVSGAGRLWTVYACVDVSISR